MTAFDAAWLDRREPADAASRNTALARQLASYLEAVPCLRIADLGAGTGANLRWLAPQLGGVQHWHLLESDPALLAGMSTRLGSWAADHGDRATPRPSGLALRETLRVTWHAADLAMEPLPRELLHGEPFHLVTASALADLVSARWLTRLAHCCAGGGSAVLLAINYDGRMHLHPPHPMDARVRDAINGHQLRDKGFGQALGPGSTAFATAALARYGFRVSQARSDWRLTPDDRDLGLALLDGWRQVAAAILPSIPRTALEDWYAWHGQALKDGTGSLRVGHTDLLALPVP